MFAAWVPHVSMQTSVAWCSAALELETLPDDEIVARAMTVLRSEYGNVTAYRRGGAPADEGDSLFTVETTHQGISCRSRMPCWEPAHRITCNNTAHLPYTCTSKAIKF